MLHTGKRALCHGFHAPDCGLNMDRNAVPQDNSHTYGGHRKLLYATDDSGEYVSVRSTGWEAETIATDSALDLLQQQQQTAWERALRGETSPLEYYMVYRRMDLALLAQTSGLFQWRIRRHFRPAVYAKLSDRILARYSEALGLDLAILKKLVEHP